MPKKSAADLMLGGSRLRREPPPPASTGVLEWRHSEFGRVTTDGRWRVMSLGNELLDVDWNSLGTFATLADAQRQAERLARQERARRCGTSRSR